MSIDQEEEEPGSPSPQSPSYDEVLGSLSDAELISLIRRPDVFEVFVSAVSRSDLDLESMMTPVQSPVHISESITFSGVSIPSSVVCVVLSFLNAHELRCVVACVSKEFAELATGPLTLSTEEVSDVQYICHNFKTLQNHRVRHLTLEKEKLEMPSHACLLNLMNPDLRRVSLRGWSPDFVARWNLKTCRHLEISRTVFDSDQDLLRVLAELVNLKTLKLDQITILKSRRGNDHPLPFPAVIAADLYIRPVSLSLYLLQALSGLKRLRIRYLATEDMANKALGILKDLDLQTLETDVITAAFWTSKVAQGLKELVVTSASYPPTEPVPEYPNLEICRMRIASNPKTVLENFPVAKKLRVLRLAWTGTLGQDAVPAVLRLRQAVPGLKVFRVNPSGSALDGEVSRLGLPGIPRGSSESSFEMDGLVSCPKQDRQVWAALPLDAKSTFCSSDSSCNK